MRRSAGETQAFERRSSLTEFLETPGTARLVTYGNDGEYTTFCAVLGTAISDCCLSRLDLILYVISTVTTRGSLTT